MLHGFVTISPLSDIDVNLDQLVFRVSVCGI